MDIVQTDIPAVKIVRPKRFGDHRDFFSETYNKRALADAGIDLEFGQDNHSFSCTCGTVRGFHPFRGIGLAFRQSFENGLHDGR
jgi:dTDP-4-dehydrorhamnose 3,5-epimerase